MSFFSIKTTPVDKWFSLFIRFRDNWTCLICGAKDIARAMNKPDMVKPGPSIIECMHILSRGNWSIRVSKQNAISGCHRCHHHFTVNELDWMEYCKKHFPQYPMLKLQAKRLSDTRGMSVRVIQSAMKEEFIAEVFKMAYHSGRLWIIEKDLGKKRIEELKARFPHPSNEIRVEYE